MAIRDPDDSVLAIFKDFAVKDEAQSAAAGRPIFTDMEIVELRFPGSKNWSAYPATAFSHWGVDPETGEQTKITYAERFSKQYRQFKSHSTQTKSGTPITYAPFLTEGRRAELRAQNVYTVEALAAIDGQELKNLGPGGREMKNAAIEFISETQSGAVNSQMQAELEALRAKSQALEEDLAALKSRETKTESVAGGDEFDGMEIDQLRDFITSNTGVEPKGALNRKTLVRMARDVAPEKANAA